MKINETPNEKIVNRITYPNLYDQLRELGADNITNLSYTATNELYNYHTVEFTPDTVVNSLDAIIFTESRMVRAHIFSEGFISGTIRQIVNNNTGITITHLLKRYYE